LFKLVKIYFVWQDEAQEISLDIAKLYQAKYKNKQVKS
jgi:hypothetical protein